MKVLDNAIAQEGIALIQVLLITAILSVLALYLSQTAREQVKQAQWANDQAVAQVALHDTESLLLFNLLTNKRQKDNNPIYLDGSDETPIVAKWNFYATPFQIGNTKVHIQDQSGLIQLHFPNRKRLEQFLSVVEPDNVKVAAIIDSLLDWQDIDSIPRLNGAEKYAYGGDNNIRDGAIPSIEDIRKISTIPKHVADYLIKNSTIYKTGAFSAYNASKDILRALTNENALQQIEALRIANTISIDQFKEITGIQETEDLYFYTSNYLMIKLYSEIGVSNASKEFYLHLNVYAQGEDMPFNVFLSRG